ncbi:hypothetical protein CEXT_739821 [Caerostris extrusa]|uniref:Uncharacterized protein n=1 Tax=Caerostris extrusa TaxID=172846 RepID=A0AAV4U8T3_CAEEX|nr:hypothetical protein CEXT_739821 [Caerostris extrusa]
MHPFLNPYLKFRMTFLLKIPPEANTLNSITALIHKKAILEYQIDINFQEEKGERQRGEKKKNQESRFHSRFLVHAMIKGPNFFIDSGLRSNLKGSSYSA